jgi:hypothetical protein
MAKGEADNSSVRHDRLGKGGRPDRDDRHNRKVEHVRSASSSVRRHGRALRQSRSR